MTTITITVRADKAPPDQLAAVLDKLADAVRGGGGPDRLLDERGDVMARVTWSNTVLVPIGSEPGA